MRSILTAIALLAASTGSALAAEYTCSIKSGDLGSGWIPSVVAVEFKEGRRDVEVFDTVIHTFVGGPIKGAITSRRENRITFGWRLRGLTGTSGQFVAVMEYRLTIRRGTGAARLLATPEGYDNRFRGRGTCNLKPD